MPKTTVTMTTMRASVDAFWMASCSPSAMKNNGREASKLEYRTRPQFDSIFTGGRDVLQINLVHAENEIP